MKKAIILLVVLGVVGFLWWSFKPEIEVVPAGGDAERGGASIQIERNPILIVDANPAKEVVYQNNAFNPAILTIKVGDKVTFMNRHTAPIRVSSNPHPIHTSFREFDSDTLQSGESYSFIFNQKMTLQYHNHFNPGVEGKVVVE